MSLTSSTKASNPPSEFHCPRCGTELNVHREYVSVEYGGSIYQRSYDELVCPKCWKGVDV